MNNNISNRTFVLAFLVLTFTVFTAISCTSVEPTTANNKAVVGAESADGAVSSTPESTATPTPEPKKSTPEFKEGDDYKTVVRPKMLAEGWKPYPSPEADQCGSGDPTCDEFPEMEACAGTGLGNCKFIWIKDDKVVNIFTVDDPQVFQSLEVEAAPKLATDDEIAGVYEYGYNHETGRDTFEYELRKDHAAMYSESREGGGVDPRRGTWKFDPASRTIAVTFQDDSVVFIIVDKGIKLVRERVAMQDWANREGDIFSKK